MEKGYWPDELNHSDFNPGNNKLDNLEEVNRNNNMW